MANPSKCKAIVKYITAHGPGIYQVGFETISTLPRFKVGQFMHLALDVYDPAGGYWPESRVFSISTVYRSTELEIIYSANGCYTKRMEEELVVGREVWLKLPYGEFIIDLAIDRDQDVVLIAGGTGVSPFLPYLEGILISEKKDREIWLYYGVRLNIMILAYNLMRRCAQVGLIRSKIFIEKEEPDETIMSDIKAERGTLDIDRIIAECSVLRMPVFFLSGPPNMIRAFRDRLIMAGIDTGRIKIDAWE